MQNTREELDKMREEHEALNKMRKARGVHTNRRIIDIETLTRVGDTVHAALSRMSEKHGEGSFASTHEIIGVLEEEMLELKEAAHRNHQEDVKKELLDIITAAWFAVACIDQKSLDW